MTVLHVGSRTLEVSSVDKVLFPDVGVSKGELAEYYAEMADYILPYVKDRPLTMERYPDGLDGEGFYEKHLPTRAPERTLRPLPCGIRGHGVHPTLLHCLRLRRTSCRKVGTDFGSSG
jgi:DNA primase